MPLACYACRHCLLLELQQDAWLLGSFVLEPEHGPTKKKKKIANSCACLAPCAPQFNASSGQPAPESITDKIFGNTQAVRPLTLPSTLFNLPTPA